MPNVSRLSASSQSFYLLPFSGKIQNYTFRLGTLIIRYDIVQEFHKSIETLEESDDDHDDDHGIEAEQNSTENNN